MTIFYVLDYAETADKFTICRNCVKKRKKIHDCETLAAGCEKNLKMLNTDSIDLNQFLTNLHCFPAYRLKIANAIVDYCGVKDKLGIQIHPPIREPIDYEWGERANRIIWERIELDEMMSWLSTLGGAFSALGDYKLACADTACRISVQQMKLATRLGEPSLIARCRLYMAIAMIQRYNFAGAKRVVQQVYREEKRQTEPDKRLIKMCLGIWSKLSYEYDLYQKQLNRPKE